MITYVIRRIGQAVAVLVGVLLIVLLLFKLQSPQALAKAMIGPRASPQQIALVVQLNGYNQPIWVQFWHEIYNYTHLDFGYSYELNAPVRTLIAEYLPKTLLLVGCATIIAIIVAVPLGVLQSVRRNKPSDYVFTGFSFIFYAMPTFVLGPVLLLYLAVDVHIFTPVVPGNLSVWQLATDWRALTLPVLTLAVVTIALFSRYMRSSMMDAMVQDYVRTARSKGLRGSTVLWHTFRNALIPLVTLLGLSVPWIVGGAVITETVFNYPGMGYLATRAAESSDLATVLGTTIVAAIATVTGSLLADISYALLDPRIRYESKQ